MAYPNITLYDNTQKIPKHIYQTYESWKDVPDAFKKRIQKFCAINNDYTYHFYNAKDREKYILNTYGKEMYNIYNSINKDYGAAKADLFRYLIIYERGGVYLDIKSYPLEPLNNIIAHDDKMLLSCWHKKIWDLQLSTGFGEFQNWFVIASPKNYNLSCVIHLVIQKILYSTPQQYKGKIGVLNLTGPITYTEALKHNLYTNNYTFKKNSYDKKLSFNGAKIPDSPYQYFDWNAHTRELKKNKLKHYTSATTDVLNHNQLKNLKNQDTLNKIYNIIDNI